MNFKLCCLVKMLGTWNMMPLYARVAEVGRLEEENVSLRKLISELRGGEAPERHGEGSGMKIKTESEEEAGRPVGPKQVNTH